MSHHHTDRRDQNPSGEVKKEPTRADLSLGKLKCDKNQLGLMLKADAQFSKILELKKSFAG